MKETLFIFSILIYLIFSPCSFATPLSFENLWVRAVPPQSKFSAVYGNIINNSNVERTVIGLSSKIADKTELHQTKEVNGMHKMQHLTQLTLKKGDRLELKPMGMHIMLIGLNSPIKKGMDIAITIHFKDKKLQTFNAKVKD